MQEDLRDHCKEKTSVFETMMDLAMRKKFYHVQTPMHFSSSNDAKNLSCNVRDFTCRHLVILEFHRRQIKKKKRKIGWCIDIKRYAKERERGERERERERETESVEFS